MQIDLTQILQEVGLSEEFEFDQEITEALDEQVLLVAPVHVNAILANTGMGILVKGQFSGTLEFMCSTCLENFQKKMKLDFEERFIPDEEHFYEENYEQELGPDDLCFTYNSDHFLDLGEMIRELIILNLPIAPKCDINCTVKNQDSEATIDPRFEVLRSIKERLT